MFKKTTILGVGITNASKQEILEYIFSFLVEKEKKGYIVTPNPEIVTYAYSHSKYQEILNKSDIALCDGVGLSLAARILGKGRMPRVTGVDLLESLCKESVRKAVTVGFLGGRRDVALKTSECLRQKYPGLKVAFAGSEWPPEEPIRVDILFVAFGFPKQEEWIFEHLSKIPVGMAMGVGGAFDYVSGQVLRAPFFLRAVGLEWLFRLIVQPWRIKRQFSLVKFMGLVLQERSKQK